VYHKKEEVSRLYLYSMMLWREHKNKKPGAGGRPPPPPPPSKKRKKSNLKLVDLILLLLLLRHRTCFQKYTKNKGKKERVLKVASA
jgi:hypothetical protein